MHQVYYTDFIRPYLEVRNKTLGLPNGASGVAAPMPTRYLNLITPEKRFQLLDKFIGTYPLTLRWEGGDVTALCGLS